MSISRYLSQFADFLSSSGVLGVTGGGTGLTSTPSNGQLDIGNGTGFTRATLTQGSGVTITNGAGSITIAASGVASDRQVFNASGTWTKPASGTYAVIQIWGSGAGGGTGGTKGGGGGGGYTSVTCLLSDITTSTVSVTINSGGAANAAGGSITFGSYLTQTGGAAGTSCSVGCGSQPTLGKSGYLSASSGLTLINSAIEQSSGTIPSLTYGGAQYNQNGLFAAPPNGVCAPGSGQTLGGVSQYNTAGTSVFGGAGGAGTGSAGGNGSAPGGGGGSGSSTSGTGAIGRVIVTVF